MAFREEGGVATACAFRICRWFCQSFFKGFLGYLGGELDERGLEALAMANGQQQLVRVLVLHNLRPQVSSMLPVGVGGWVPCHQGGSSSKTGLELLAQ